MGLIVDAGVSVAGGVALLPGTGGMVLRTVGSLGMGTAGGLPAGGWRADGLPFGVGNFGMDGAVLGAVFTLGTAGVVFGAAGAVLGAVFTLGTAGVVFGAAGAVLGATFGILFGFGFGRVTDGGLITEGFLLGAALGPVGLTLDGEDFLGATGFGFLACGVTFFGFSALVEVAFAPIFRN